MSVIFKNICVFCAASPNVGEVYKSVARDMGKLCADEGWGLVYGGGHRGLMGAVADSALAHGAEVIGVIPRYLKDKEIAHTGVTELHTTETMHERQMKMAELSDAFVVLPGGLGTLAELFEVLTWRQLGLHDKPIILVNVDGYWDSLIAMLEHAAQERFLHGDYRKMLEILENLKELLIILGKTPTKKDIQPDLL